MAQTQTNESCQRNRALGLPCDPQDAPSNGESTSQALQPEAAFHREIYRHITDCLNAASLARVPLSACEKP